MVARGRKKTLAWTTEAEEAFEDLKERLFGKLGLFLVDPDKGFVLRTDTSDYAVGVVLEQVRLRWNTCPGGPLKSSLAGRPTSEVDCEGEGHLCHCLPPLEMVGPHRTATRGGMHRS